MSEKVLSRDRNGFECEDNNKNNNPESTRHRYSPEVDEE